MTCEYSKKGSGKLSQRELTENSPVRRTSFPTDRVTTLGEPRNRREMENPDFRKDLTGALLTHSKARQSPNQTTTAQTHSQ